MGTGILRGILVPIVSSNPKVSTGTKRGIQLLGISERLMVGPPNLAGSLVELSATGGNIQCPADIQEEGRTPVSAWVEALLHT